MAEPGSGVYDILDYGAVGDGKTVNTAAIQKALDEAGAGGGGTVRVPPGTFMTGTIFLRSGVTLDIHPAGRILGSPNLDDYTAKRWGQHIDRTPWHLVAAFGVHDVKVCGGGTIDGNGPAFWEPVVAGPDSGDEGPPGAFGGLDAIHVVAARHAADPARAPLAWIRANKERRPSPMVEITGCANVRIQDVHITNSAGWLLHLHNSEMVWIRGVQLTSNLMGPNNDGFDITGCRDVMVSDCHLSCCDDAICLKTTPDSNPCERITVTNCVIRTKCVALKFGCSETFHDFRQVTFSNSVVYESSRAVGIYVKEGATIEDVAISNIVCDTRNPFMANRPIHLDCTRRSPESKLGKIRNVTISNVICRTDGRILLTSQPDSPLENIVLRDIQVAYPTIDDPDPIADQVACGQFSPGNPEARRARGVVVAENIRGFVLENLLVAWPKTDPTGAIECPPEWDFPIKACNGMFDTFFERSQYNTGKVPPFHVLWAKNVKGGYLSAPLARPASPEIEKYALEDCDIQVR